MRELGKPDVSRKRAAPDALRGDRPRAVRAVGLVRFGSRGRAVVVVRRW